MTGLPSADDPPPSSPSHARTINTVLAVVILVLLGQMAWQQLRISGLEADRDQARRSLDEAVERMATERLHRLRREELVAAVQWLDDTYRSADGLQRPGGLWRAETNRPDGEAIGVWILDIYLQARLAGASEAEARDAVLTQIRATEEWRKKHGG